MAGGQQGEIYETGKRGGDLTKGENLQRVEPRIYDAPIARRANALREHRVNLRKLLSSVKEAGGQRQRTVSIGVLAQLSKDVDQFTHSAVAPRVEWHRN